MIVNEKTNRVASNLGEARGFTIDASAKAFHILSSSLYKDKITAVLREITTNGIDANVAAGNTDKVIVHLPRPDEPYFSVKDQGIGLDHEDVMVLYTTYFRSTKTESNDLIGGFGLGSKSPFAYTDQFQVVSIFNGKKRSYAALINSENLPEISLVNEVDTTDRNGLEVYVPVNSKDIQEFQQKAGRLFFWMKDQVEVNLTFKWNLEKSSAFPGSKFTIYDDTRTNSYDQVNLGGVFVKMGSSIYPVDLDQIGALPDGPTRTLIRNKFGSYSRRAIVFNCNIGEVDLAPSRESLSYDKRTLKNLIHVMDAGVEELREKASESILNTDSDFIVARKASEIYQVIGYYPNHPRVEDLRKDNFKVKASFVGATAYDFTTYGKQGRIKLQNTMVEDMAFHNADRKPVIIKVGKVYGKNRVPGLIKDQTSLYHGLSSLIFIAVKDKIPNGLLEFFGLCEEDVKVAVPVVKDKTVRGTSTPSEVLGRSLGNGVQLTLSNMNSAKNAYWVDRVHYKDSWIYRISSDLDYLETSGLATVYVVEKVKQRKLSAKIKPVDDLRKDLAKIVLNDYIEMKKKENFDRLVRNPLCRIVVDNAGLPAVSEFITTNAYLAPKNSSNGLNTFSLNHVCHDMLYGIELNPFEKEITAFINSNLVLKMISRGISDYSKIHKDEEVAMVEMVNTIKLERLVKIA